jgi:ribonucleoside-diphosphate reductase alpha chain
MPALRDAPRGHRLLASSNAQDVLCGLIERRQFIPGGRYLYASGRPFHQVNNCLLLNAEDTREGWADLQYKATMALMTGAGIGVYYGQLREADALVTKTGGTSSGPVPLMMMVNETGRNVMQGGSRRSAIWAGLPWWHPDVDKFIRAKDWPEWLRTQKEQYWNVPAPLDMTNISVCLDDAFFTAYHDPANPDHERARSVYHKTVEKMVTTGEPGFSVDTGEKSGEVLRNACTEITSADDSDVCNLGSLVMPRFSTPEQFGDAVRQAVLFLTAGSLYSDVPYERVSEIRSKNRRLGLGLIGVHEFCLLRGVQYGSPESFEVLDPFMREYDRALEYAIDWQDKLGISRSIAATAIAPNGTIGVVAESTPSADPMFSSARERILRMAGAHVDTYEKHIVVDPVAKRLVAQGVAADSIEDAYSLSAVPERRLSMQAYMQSHVDQAVSSTVNLPYPLRTQREQLDFGDTLMAYLPQLRGVTAYPDGARAGQPLKSIPLTYALEHEGEVFYESVEETCSGGVCGV